MEAYNTETEEEEMLLVGVQLDDDNKPECFPLAKILKQNDMLNYLAPNGKGGYYDMTNEAEVEEVKKNMRAAPITEPSP